MRLFSFERADTWWFALLIGEHYSVQISFHKKDIGFELHKADGEWFLCLGPLYVGYVK